MPWHLPVQPERGGLGISRCCCRTRRGAGCAAYNRRTQRKSCRIKKYFTRHVFLTSFSAAYEKRDKMPNEETCLSVTLFSIRGPLGCSVVGTRSADETRWSPGEHPDRAAMKEAPDAALRREDAQAGADH